MAICCLDDDFGTLSPTLMVFNRYQKSFSAYMRIYSILCNLLTIVPERRMCYNREKRNVQEYCVRRQPFIYAFDKGPSSVRILDVKLGCSFLLHIAVAPLHCWIACL